MTIRSPLILGLAALFLTACAMAGSVNTLATMDVVGPQPARAPFHCALRLTQTGGQVAVEARVQSPALLSGTYAMHITGAGGATNIRQSGDFRSTGQTPVILGTAALGGAAHDYVTTLTVRTGGRMFDCPVERP